MIGRRPAAIAADEAHGRPAIPLAGEEEEVADDQPEVVEVPVQSLDVLRRLQHHVPESLDHGRHARWSLGGVDAVGLVTEVEHLRALRGQAREFPHPRPHLDRGAAGIAQPHRDPADALRQRRGGLTGAVGQSQHVRLVLGPEGQPPETGLAAAVDHHALDPAVGAAQPQLALLTGGGVEPERAREGLRPGQIRLVELQPGQAADFDDRVGGPTRVLASERPGLAVQRVVRPHDVGHRLHLPL